MIGGTRANRHLGKEAQGSWALLALLLLAGCRTDPAQDSPAQAAAPSFQPPAGWSTEPAAGLTWSAIPPSGDPLAGQARLSLSELAMADAVPPSGELQIASLVEGRDTRLPSGQFETLRHRRAVQGGLAGLETESTLTGAGGARRLRQFCCWQGGRQYSLTLVAAEAQYDAASAVFEQVVSAAGEVGVR